MPVEVASHKEGDVEPHTAAHVDALPDMDGGKEAQPTYTPGTAEEKALVRKIDVFLMPAIWIMYLLSYMDRSSLGNAKVAGMDDALGLSDTQYSLAINLFQVSYIVFSVPSNMVLARVRRPSLYLATIMGLWGAVVACMAAVRTPGQLLGLRFALGLFEAGYAPAVFYLFATWYRKAEQSRRFLVFWTAGILSGAFAGMLAGLIARGLDGRRGLAGWRWLFLVEGVVTVAAALLAPLVLLDYPASCAKLTPAQRELAIKRLEADGLRLGDGGDGTNPSSRMPPWRPLLTALTTPTYWFLFLGFMSVDGSFSIAYFYPTLVEGLGYDSVTAQFMTAPLYVVVLPVAIAIAVLADRATHRRALYLAVTMLLASLFSGLSAAVTPYAARYVLMCLLNVAMYSAVPLALSFATTALASAEPEVRAVALGFMGALGNLAQIYSSYLWPEADAPRYIKGFCSYAGILAVGAGLYIMGHMVLKRRA